MLWFEIVFVIIALGGVFLGGGIDTTAGAAPNHELLAMQANIFNLSGFALVSGVILITCHFLMTKLSRLGAITISERSETAAGAPAGAETQD